MIAELALSVCLLAVLLFHFYSAREWAAQRDRLINHLQAKGPGEFTLLQRASGSLVKPKDPERELSSVPPHPMGL